MAPTRPRECPLGLQAWAPSLWGAKAADRPHRRPVPLPGPTPQCPPCQVPGPLPITQHPGVHHHLPTALPTVAPQPGSNRPPDLHTLAPQSPALLYPPHPRDSAKPCRAPQTRPREAGGHGEGGTPLSPKNEGALGSRVGGGSSGSPPRQETTSSLATPQPLWLLRGAGPPSLCCCRGGFPSWESSPISPCRKPSA